MLLHGVDNAGAATCICAQRSRCPAARALMKRLGNAHRSHDIVALGVWTPREWNLEPRSRSAVAQPVLLRCAGARPPTTIADLTCPAAVLIGRTVVEKVRSDARVGLVSSVCSNGLEPPRAVVVTYGEGKDAQSLVRSLDAVRKDLAPHTREHRGPDSP